MWNSNLPETIKSKQNVRYVSEYHGYLWFFTLNNPETNDINWDSHKIKWAVWQLERGSEGTLHLQGTFKTSLPMKFGAVKFLLGPRFHLELCRNETAAIRYCTKTESRVEGPFRFGSVPEPNEDGPSPQILTSVQEIDLINNLINQDLGFCEIYEQIPDIAKKHMLYLERKLKEVKQVERELGFLKVFYFYGPGFTGKTSLALLYCQINNWSYYYKQPGEWWPGYNGQDAIIFDEMTAKEANIQFLNSLINRQISDLPIKGGFVKFRSKILFLISNFTFDQLFSKYNLTYRETLDRRIEIEGCFDRNVNDIELICSEYDITEVPKALQSCHTMRYTTKDLHQGKLIDITSVLFKEKNNEPLALPAPKVQETKNEEPKVPRKRGRPKKNK